MVDTPQRSAPERALEIGWLAAAIVVPIVFNPWGHNAFELPKTALLKALVLLMLLAALVRVGEARAQDRASRDANELRLYSPMLWSVLALGLALGTATALSVNPRASLWGDYQRQQGLLTLIAYLALFLLTAASLRTRAQADRLWRALIWGSAPIVFYALAQAFRLDPLDWRTDAASPLVSTIGRSNFVGAYLVLILPLTIARAFVSSHKRVYIVFAAAQLLCLALTLARSAWLGAFVTMLLIGTTTARARRIVLAVVALMLCAILLVTFAGASWLAPIPGLERLTNLARTDEGSTAARLTTWQTTLALIAARPLLGYGPETMQIVFARVFPPQLVYYQGRQFAVNRAHNVWLDLAMSAGVIGAACFLVVLIVMGRAAWKRWRNVSDLWERWLLIALAGSLSGHLVDLEFGFEVTATATVFWLVLALAVALGRGLSTATSHEQTRLRWTDWAPYAPAAALIVLLIGTICARPALADIAFRESQLETRAPLARLAAGEQAVQLWSLEPEYHLHLAWLYFAVGLPYNSEAELLAAERLNPGDPRVWATRGDLYARWAQVDAAQSARAEAAYQRAIALAPNVATYHAALGSVLAQQGRREEAVAALRRAVDLDATDAMAYRALGDVYMALGREAEAAWAWKEAQRWSKK